jgi:hypothetical protein
MTNIDESNSTPQRVGEILDDVIADLRDRPKRCFIEDGSIIFRDGKGYDIPLAQCDTYDKILAWQLQLSTKNWMTLELLMQFTLIACDYHHLSIPKI